MSEENVPEPQEQAPHPQTERHDPSKGCTEGSAEFHPPSWRCCRNGRCIAWRGFNCALCSGGWAASVLKEALERERRGDFLGVLIGRWKTSISLPHKSVLKGSGHVNRSPNPRYRRTNSFHLRQARVEWLGFPCRYSERSDPSPPFPKHGSRASSMPDIHGNATTSSR